jgi:hypothetical protein
LKIYIATKLSGFKRRKCVLLSFENSPANIVIEFPKANLPDNHQLVVPNIYNST